jgi:hypothetical protein
MMILGKRTFGLVLLVVAVPACLAIIASMPAMAVEVGQPAPNFSLPSTFGNDISLSDFRGKKFVLLEFYHADFAPS